MDLRTWSPTSTVIIQLIMRGWAVRSHGMARCQSIEWWSITNTDRDDRCFLKTRQRRGTSDEQEWTCIATQRSSLRSGVIDKKAPLYLRAKYYEFQKLISSSFCGLFCPCQDFRLHSGDGRMSGKGWIGSSLDGNCRGPVDGPPINEFAQRMWRK